MQASAPPQSPDLFVNTLWKQVWMVENFDVNGDKNSFNEWSKFDKHKEL